MKLSKTVENAQELSGTVNARERSGTVNGERSGTANDQER
jgi:hypothetical protein